jgi:ABC-type glycerol-3-phosphate transport system substrate-binding protein
MGHGLPGVAHRSRFGRTVGAAATAFTMAVALAACGAGGDDTAGDGAETVTVLVEGGGKAELEPVAEAFTEETGTKVSLVELPYDGLFDRLSSEFSSGSVSFDVAALDAIWLTGFADGVEPLDDMFTDEVRADLFPALVEEAQVDGTFVGMPVWTNAEILFYRTDLFEDPKQQAAFDKEYGYPLAPPTDWQQFQDMAAFFTQDTDGDGTTDLYGTDVKGAVETEWLAHVAQAGSPGMVLDEDGNVIIDNDEHLAALDFYTEAVGDAPEGASQVDWAAAQNLFNQGQVAMTKFWAHAYPQIPDDASVKGKVGAAPMIAGDAGIGAVPGNWYLSIPKAGDNKELAEEFIQFAYDHNDLSIESALGLAARKSAFEKYAGKPGYEHFDALIATLEGPATMPRPANAKWQQIVDTALIPMIQKAVEPGADNQALLDEAKAQIEEILG